MRNLIQAPKSQRAGKQHSQSKETATRTLIVRFLTPAGRFSIFNLVQSLLKGAMQLAALIKNWSNFKMAILFLCLSGRLSTLAPKLHFFSFLDIHLLLKSLVFQEVNTCCC